MALSKIKNNDSGDVVQLSSQNEIKESVKMLVGAEGLSLIIDRLTDIYTDPIAASVREPVTNAIDALMELDEADRKPIEITLPKAARPVFQVKDYAAGMSLETVKQIYSQYGGSKKGENFDQVGAYGLGAKAPLAYCSEFQVVTTHMGVTTMLTMTRTDKGNFVNIHSSEVTNLPSGTTVSIPVKLEDKDRFREAVETFSNFSFDISIKIDGVLSSGTDKYVQIADDLILDSETNRNGRIWIKRDELPQLVNTLINAGSLDTSSLTMDFVLYGWKYSNPNDRNSGGYYNYNKSPNVIVEILPGVVDFSSGRDEITNNDRAKDLQTKVLDYFNFFDSSVVENIFKIYKTYNEAEATDFFVRLNQYLSSLEFYNDDEIVNMVRPSIRPTWYNHRVGNGSTSGNDVPNLHVPFDYWVTNSGFNPLSLLTNKSHNNVYGYLLGKVYHYNSKMTLLRVNPMNDLKPEVDKNNGPDFKFSSVTTSKPKGGVTEIVEGLASNVKTGVIRPLDSVLFEIHLTGDVNGSNKMRVFVISGADEKSVRQIISGRKHLNLKENGFLIVFVNDNDKAVDDHVAIAEKINPNFVVEKITAKNFVEKIAKQRRAVSEANKTSGEPKGLISTFKISTNGQANNREVVDNLLRTSFRSFSKNEVSAAEIRENGDFLVLVKADHNVNRKVSHVLMGAANAGVDLTSGDIYVLSTAGRPITAADMTELLDYSKVLISNSYSYNAKAFTELQKNNVYNSPYLYEGFDEKFSRGLIALTAVVMAAKTTGHYYSVPMPNLTVLSKFFKKNPPADSNYSLMIDEIVSSVVNDYNTRDNIVELGKYPVEFLMSRFTENEAKILTGLGAALVAVENNKTPSIAGEVTAEEFVSNVELNMIYNAFDVLTRTSWNYETRTINMAFEIPAILEPLFNKFVEIWVEKANLSK